MGQGRNETKNAPFLGNPTVQLLLALSATFGVGFIAAQANFRGLPFWYQTLAKPSWTPPNWLFGPVWTILYAMMGIAAWLVWRTEPDDFPSGRKTTAMVLFAAQLILNGLWSWLFFGWNLIFAAAIEIALLALLILATMVVFFRINRTSGWLFAPYLAWVAFATALNFAIWRLNAGA